MKTEQRLFLSLLASFVVAALLLVALQITDSTVLFLPQVPGFFACAMLWGVHSGFTAASWIFWVGTNTLAYWPLLFGASHLIRKRLPD